MTGHTPSPQSVVSDRALEQIAFNLCSLHDFDPAFVQQNERFAKAAITEYLRAATAPAAPQAAGVGEARPVVRNDGEAVRALSNLMAPFGGYIKKHAPALYDDMEAALRAPSREPESEAAKGPGGYLVKDFADGWYWTPNASLDHASGASVWSVSDRRYETDPPALATREEAPAEAGEIDLYDDKVQAGIAWTMRQWGETLGLKTWTGGDGSESVEGDVGAEIHTILVDAGLRDPETNEMASLRAQPQAREETQPIGWLRAADEEMVCAHLGVAEAEDSYETAKKKLASLIQWNIAVAMDPSVGGHPSLDALRVAVEALEAIKEVSGDRAASGYNETGRLARINDRCDQVLAALQAEQGAK